jgi:hypothetical protein
VRRCPCQTETKGDTGDAVTDRCEFGDSAGEVVNAQCISTWENALAFIILIYSSSNRVDALDVHASFYLKVRQITSRQLDEICRFIWIAFCYTLQSVYIFGLL